MPTKRVPTTRRKSSTKKYKQGEFDTLLRARLSDLIEAENPFTGKKERMRAIEWAAIRVVWAACKEGDQRKLEFLLNRLEERDENQAPGSVADIMKRTIRGRTG